MDMRKLRKTRKRKKKFEKAFSWFKLNWHNLENLSFNARLNEILKAGFDDEKELPQSFYTLQKWFRELENERTKEKMV